MATVPDALTTLENGDRMSRAEFHRIYEQMAEDFRAELIGGTVYVASPLKRKHGSYHLFLGTLFTAYEGNTPGVEAGDNATILLGEEGEPQPDLYLRILPEFGGQSRTTADDYVEGAPECLAEIALSSRSIDLHAKLEDYRRYGVLEYLVMSLRERKLWWFDLRSGNELPADADGVCRMRSFPGLWLHVESLWSRDYRKAMSILEQGLASAEHEAFVQRLQAGGAK
jgi:Uma2 family endonuclease